MSDSMAVLPRETLPAPGRITRRELLRRAPPRHAYRRRRSRHSPRCTASRAGERVLDLMSSGYRTCPPRSTTRASSGLGIMSRLAETHAASQASWSSITPEVPFGDATFDAVIVNGLGAVSDHSPVDVFASVGRDASGRSLHRRRLAPDEPDQGRGAGTALSPSTLRLITAYFNWPAGSSPHVLDRSPAGADPLWVVVAQRSAVWQRGGFRASPGAIGRASMVHLAWKFSPRSSACFQPARVRRRSCPQHRRPAATADAHLARVAAEEDATGGITWRRECRRRGAPAHRRRRRTRSCPKLFDLLVDTAPRMESGTISTTWGSYVYTTYQRDLLRERPTGAPRRSPPEVTRAVDAWSSSKLQAPGGPEAGHHRGRRLRRDAGPAQRASTRSLRRLGLPLPRVSLRGRQSGRQSARGRNRFDAVRSRGGALILKHREPCATRHLVDGA